MKNTLNNKSLRPENGGSIPLETPRLSYSVEQRPWPNWNPRPEMFMDLASAKARAIQLVEWNWQVLHSASIFKLPNHEYMGQVRRVQLPQIAPPPAGLSGAKNVVVEEWVANA